MRRPRKTRRRRRAAAGKRGGPLATSAELTLTIRRVADLRRLFPADGTPVHGVPAEVTGEPADVDAPVIVTWRSLDEETGDEEAVEEECRWAARDGRFPAVGDPVLLFLDGVADPWALVWASGTP